MQIWFGGDMVEDQWLTFAENGIETGATLTVAVMERATLREILTTMLDVNLRLAELVEHGNVFSPPHLPPRGFHWEVQEQQEAPPLPMGHPPSVRALRWRGLPLLRH